MERCATKLEVTIDPAKKHFFSEIISSVSSACFNPKDSNQIICRDYLSVKLWDIRNNTKPMKSFAVTDYIDKKLCDLYESESVFDKFQINCSSDGKQIITGAYNNNAHIIDIDGRSNTSIEAIFGNKRGKPCGVVRNYKGKKLPAVEGGSAPDLKKKVILNAWHPSENIIACANHNCIFIFNEEKKHLKK